MIFTYKILAALTDATSAVEAPSSVVSGLFLAGSRQDQRAAPELAEDITERHIVSPYLRL
jgi:hypothetical protein